MKDDLGLLALDLVGRRSYKNFPKPGRLISRKDVVHELARRRLDAVETWIETAP